MTNVLREHVRTQVHAQFCSARLPTQTDIYFRNQKQSFTHRTCLRSSENIQSCPYTKNMSHEFSIQRAHKLQKHVVLTEKNTQHADSRSQSDLQKRCAHPSIQQEDATQSTYNPDPMLPAHSRGLIVHPTRFQQPLQRRASIARDPEQGTKHAAVRLRQQKPVPLLQPTPSKTNFSPSHAAHLFFSASQPSQLQACETTTIDFVPLLFLPPLLKLPSRATALTPQKQQQRPRPATLLPEQRHGESPPV